MQWFHHFCLLDNKNNKYRIGGNKYSISHSLIEDRWGREVRLTCANILSFWEQSSYTSQKKQLHGQL